MTEDEFLSKWLHVLEPLPEIELRLFAADLGFNIEATLARVHQRRQSGVGLERNKKGAGDELAKLAALKRD
jgi:hypothetical protein